MFYTRSINNFILNRRGGVAIIFVMVLIPMMCVTSMLIDYSRALYLKNKITQATDAASLSAANIVMKEINLSTIDKTNKHKVRRMLKNKFKSFFHANVKGAIKLEGRNPKVRYNLKTQKVKIDVKADYSTIIFERIFALLPSRKGIPIQDWHMNITATTYMKAEKKSSTSIFFVFDHSASMKHKIMGQNQTRISALQNATKELISYLNKQDPEKKYIHIGALAYAGRILKKTGKIIKKQKIFINENKRYGFKPGEVEKGTELDWNIDAVQKFLGSSIEIIKDPRLGIGGTDIHQAMLTANKAFDIKEEISKHKKKNGMEPNLAIVLMTDGENGYGPNNESIEAMDDRTLKTCDMIKKSGIKIYTVAFVTPKKGRALLKKCASGGSYHYDANNVEKLTLAYRHIGARALGKEHLALYE